MPTVAPISDHPLTPGPWCDGEFAGWAPPEDLRPSEFTERHRVLTRRQSSRPGPWKNENAPPLAVIMDLCVRRTIREIWIRKAAQLGVSEAIRNVIMFVAVRDPDPLLLVLPNEQVGRKIVRKRLIPLFEDTACLAELATESARDKKLTAITLANGFDLQLAWSGSAAALASDPFRRVILDEVDKFEAYAGVEASPVDLARVRTNTYPDSSLLVGLSTPTVDSGPISVAYDDCPVKLDFYAPCPHCGRPQRLVQPRLKWEKYPELADAKDRAARLRLTKAAWFECDGPDCGKRITEVHKLGMLKAGYWGTPDGGWKLYCDGREEGDQPAGGDKIGIQYGAEIDLSVSWAKIAAEFVEAYGRPDKLQHHYNSTLGLPFSLGAEAPKVGIYKAKCRPDPDTGFTPPAARVLPLWVSRLVLTVDTQKDLFFFLIRGWGAGLRSQRIHHGRARSFEELEELYQRAFWHYEGDKYPAITCHQSGPMGIDSGGGMAGGREVDANRTEQVYQWCLQDPMRRLALKGASKPFDEHIRARNVTYTPPGQKRDPFKVLLHLVDPVYYRELLTGYAVAKVNVVDEHTGEVTDEQVDQWMLNDVDDEEYNRHLAAVQKTKTRRGRSHVEAFVPRPPGARHDYHDLESYQFAMALGPSKCYALPSSAQLARLHEASKTPAAAGGMRTPDGRSWLPKR